MKKFWEIYNSHFKKYCDNFDNCLDEFLTFITIVSRIYLENFANKLL